MIIMEGRNLNFGFFTNTLTLRKQREKKGEKKSCIFLSSMDTLVCIRQLDTTFFSPLKVEKKKKKKKKSDVNL